MTRLWITYAALVLTQAAHSFEEYRGQLWESFPPARFLTGLLFDDHRTGFLVINIALVAAGVWGAIGPVRSGRPSGRTFAWIWVGIELINGIGHPLWSLRQGGYTPGLATAPILLVLALALAGELFPTPCPPPPGMR